MQKVIKRDGRVAPFEIGKITEAIWKAAQAVGGNNRNMAETITKEIVEILENTFKPSHYPTVEQVQDLVEKTLMEKGHAKTAKAYILYRHKRTEERRLQEKLIGSPTKIPFSIEGLEAFEKHFHESPEEIFQKTSHFLAQNKKEEAAFYDLLANLEFLPHPHILKTASQDQPLCFFHEFIIPTTENLFYNLKNASELINNGAKISINLDEFDKPANLLKLFQNTAALSQNHQLHLATISKNHPAILDVLKLKTDEIDHFEILQTEESLNLLPESRFPASNYEPIALGWINLTKTTTDNLIIVAKTAELFLKRVFEKSIYPLKEISEQAENHKIHIGLMGLAEVLFKENIPYNSYGAGVFIQNILGQLDAFPIELIENQTVADLLDTTNGLQPFHKKSHLEKIAIEKGFYSPQLMTAIEKAGSLKPFDQEIPKDIRENIFTIQDLEKIPREHRPLEKTSLHKAKKWVTT